MFLGVSRGWSGNVRYMTTTAEPTIVLSFEERFTVALMRAGMTLTSFAEYVGTTRKTLWRYETLRDEPRASVLRVLAAEAHVPYEWLRPSDEELAEGRRETLPRMDSNHQPAGYSSALVDAMHAEVEALLMVAASGPVDGAFATVISITPDSSRMGV